MFDPARIIQTLNAHRVRYLLIGGLAATLHGCPEQTYDLDILYEDSHENRVLLLAALEELEACWDVGLTEPLLRTQPVFALNTRHGDLDIFSAIPGIARFEDAFAVAECFSIGSEDVRALTLRDLIVTKAAVDDPNPRKQSALLYLKQLYERRKTADSR